MNILTESLPDSVDVDGVSYKVHTDFRTCIRVVLAFEDNDLTPQEKQIIMLQNIYKTIPGDVPGAIAAALWFLNGGEEGTESEPSMRLYSFSKDHRFIYAAFRQTHGIDLQESPGLHWFSFLSLFADLGSDSTFCQLVALRKRIKTGKATAEERAAARDMGELLEVEEVDTRTLEEKEAADLFERKVEEARAKREALKDVRD